MLFCQYRDFDQIDEVVAQFFCKDDHLHSFVVVHVREAVKNVLADFAR